MNREIGKSKAEVVRAQRLHKYIQEAIFEFECAIPPDKWTKDLIHVLHMFDEIENVAWLVWLGVYLRNNPPEA
jgi:hypothetical protein